MISICTYLKFEQELSICAAKDKHRFHVKKINCILYFSFKINIVLDPWFPMGAVPPPVGVEEI
jgi:hypothetical protein